MLELEKAAYDVEVFENYCKRLVTLHVDLCAPIDWRGIATMPPPPEPVVSPRGEKHAKETLESYKPSWLDKLFKRSEARRCDLLTAVELARSKDEQEIATAKGRHRRERDEWRERQQLAESILALDPQTCLASIEEVNPFGEIAELGSHIDFRTNDSAKAVVEADISTHGVDLIPKEHKSLLKSGRLAIKPLPKGRFFELYQDYICSSSLRVAGDLFALLPISVAVVTTIDQALNTKTGHLENQPVLSVAIPRGTFESLNLASIDPSDSMANFIHNMHFLKTKGFKSVQKIDLAQLPAEILASRHSRCE